MGWWQVVDDLQNLIGSLTLMKAYLTKKSQVPELNETLLVEGKKQLKNDDSHLRILSNMM